MLFRALLIDPVEKTITEVKSRARTNDIAALLDCTNPEPFVLVASECLYVDEDGLFQDDPAFFSMGGFHDPFAGRGMIIGVSPTGRHAHSHMMLAEAERQISFPDIELVGFEPVSSGIQYVKQKLPKPGTRPMFRKNGGTH